MLKTIDVARRKLPELIAEQIVELIRSEPLNPGDRLPTEAELSRQLGVGRTSVREALQKLQTLGLLEVVRGRGTFVCAPNNDDGQLFARWSIERRFAIEELLEARIAIELAAAALASGRATLEEIEHLEHLNLDHLAAARADDLGEVVRTDQHFHEALIASSHNQILSRLYAVLVAELTDFRQKTLGRSGVPERSARQHARIVDALRKRDHSAAREAVLQHLWILFEEIDAAARKGNDAETTPAFSARDALA